MFKNRDLLYLQDILDSIQKIEQYTEDFTFERFFKDRKTQDAVLRNLEIIGEASRYISQEAKKRSPEIPWRRGNPVQRSNSLTSSPSLLLG